MTSKTPSLPALPNLTVLPDADAVAAALAERIVALAEGRDRAAVALAGGSTPQRLYRLLATPALAARVPWSRLHLFWGDERFVPFADKDSNTRMVHEALIQHVPIPPANVHAVPSDAADPDQAAAAYEAELRRYLAGAPGPLFDLVILGMGDDGHTASLFPGKPALQEDARWVVAVPEAGMAPYVPRVSLTFPAIASSREVAILVTGAGKAAMVRRVAAGQDLPVRRVVSEGKLCWYLDEAVTGAPRRDAANGGRYSCVKRRI